MCKHVSAVLYGVGARLDEQPELLFRLRQVDEKDLIATSDGRTRLTSRAPAKSKVLAAANLSELFGLQMGTEENQRAPKKVVGKRPAAAKRAKAKKTSAKKTTAKKTSPKKVLTPTHAKAKKKPAKKSGRRT